MGLTLEQHGQIGHHAVNKIQHTLQRWDERLTIENPNFVERYKKGELQFLLEFSTGLIPKEYVILFRGLIAASVVRIIQGFVFAPAGNNSGYMLGR